MGLYWLILLLQGFCLYQVYSKGEDQKWYLIILFLPLIGSLIYLYQVYLANSSIDDVTEKAKDKFIPEYKLNKLEKDVVYTDTMANKIQLADEYIENGHYASAEKLLISCLEGIYSEDEELLMRLVQVHYLEENYEKVVLYGKKLEKAKTYQHSNEKVAVAWSYYEIGNREETERLFSELNVRFSNYPYRLEYAYFLERSGRIPQAISELEAMLKEIESMDVYERKLKKSISRKIQKYYKYLHNSE